jgi:L-2-hydroxycarboxylate dehydrogenase (NAD+)
MNPKTQMIDHKQLFDFINKLVHELGVSDEDAKSIATNLVASSLRGIDSHGVGQLKLYVAGIQSGFIIPNAKHAIVRENPVLTLVNANNGLGQIAGIFSMEMAINKAQETGIGLVTVSNSNHYGFAGYYAMMALKQNLIGIIMTNSPLLIIPTFGRNAIIGSNPIAMAVPTKSGSPWVLDMATGVVSIGKIDVYF